MPHTDQQRARARAVKQFGKVVDVCCTAFKVDINELLSPLRNDHITECRMHCAYLMRQLGGSFPAIAKHLRRDHSSIIHEVNTITRRVANSSERRRLVEKLQLAINGGGVPHDEEWWNRT